MSDYIRELKAIERPQSRVIFEVWKMWGKLISDYLMICGILVSQWSVILNHFAFFAISDYIRELKAIERPQSRVIFEVWKMWGKLISEYLMICGILVSQWSVILNHFAFFAISEPGALWARKNSTSSPMSDYIRELKAIERPQSRVIFEVWKMWGKLISDYLMICGILVSQWSVILNHFAFFAISDYIRELKAIERP
jgi:uncharacterized membrane protein